MTARGVLALAGVLSGLAVGPGCMRASLSSGAGAEAASVSTTGPGASATSTSPPAAPTTTPAPAGLVVSAGPGWSEAGLDGPLPAPGTCHALTATGGAALPDPACTPGAVDGTVTQADLGATLCRPGGYTSSVRPPESMTEPFKYAAMRAYGDGGSAGLYELDHLVPLELGGASDTRNLWPEPDDHPSPGVANSKDPVENQLHDMVCAAVGGGPYVPLATAQRLIATDWTTAVARARAALVAG